MPNYSWQCRDCEVSVEIHRPMAQSDIPPGAEFECLCPRHKAIQWQRVYEMPGTTKESFLDGHKRKGWSELKEAAKLQREAAVSSRDKRKEIAQEIRRMGVKPGKDM